MPFILQSHFKLFLGILKDIRVLKSLLLIYTLFVFSISMEEEKQDEKSVPTNANEHCPGIDSKEAGKKDACDGCPNQGMCASGEGKNLVKSFPAIQARMKLIKHKVLVLSGKGGVGKSTVSSQIAFYLASQGYNVGLLDLDLCGPSVPKMMGLQGHEVHQSNEGWSPVWIEDNLAVMSIGFILGDENAAVIWRGPRKDRLIEHFLADVDWGELDYLVIDSKSLSVNLAPPGTSDEHISCIQYLECSPEKDGAIIVTTPQEVALADVRKEINFCQKTNTKIFGVVENMSGFICPHCTKESTLFPPTTGGAEKLCLDYSLELLSKISLDPLVMLSAEKGKSLFSEQKDQNLNSSSIPASQIQTVGESKEIFP